MRNLLFVGVMLLLVISAVGYKFGDIIAFPREKSCGKIKFTYKHYAIYVGKEMGKDEDTIFERPGLLKGCVFGKLDNSKQQLDNYLSDFYTVNSKEEMIEMINKKEKNCGLYRPFANNCEHLATEVHYGAPISTQRGTNAQGKCPSGHNHDYKTTDAILAKLAALDDPDKACDVICPNNSCV